MPMKSFYDVNYMVGVDVSDDDSDEGWGYTILGSLFILLAVGLLFMF